MAERTLALVETGWRSGRFDIFRVTTAARDVARVRSLRLDALEAAWLDRIALERATGGIR
jgi:outer membrane protein TolC